MAKHTRYQDIVSHLANAAIRPVDIGDVSSGYRVLLELLWRDWLPPFDREDLARLGQLLVSVSRRVTALADGEYAALTPLLAILPATVEQLWQPKADMALQTICDAYDRCEQIAAPFAPPSLRVFAAIDAVRDCLDALICIILK